MKNRAQIEKKIKAMLANMDVHPTDHFYARLLNEGVESKDVLTYKEIDQKLSEIIEIEGLFCYN